MQQMMFPGLTPARPREVHNLFFALWPGESTRAQIAAAAAELREKRPTSGRWINPRRYHMTLLHLGEHAEVPPQLIAQARRVGDGVQAAPFEFALNLAGSFRNSRIPWWLGCASPAASLDALQREIANAYRSSGRSSFVPHVTIARDCDRPLQEAAVTPIAWPVDEFVLIDSLLGPTSTYTIVQRWICRLG